MADDEDFDFEALGKQIQALLPRNKGYVLLLPDITAPNTILTIATVSPEEAIRLVQHWLDCRAREVAAVRIPLSAEESVYLSEAPEAQSCDVHDWPPEKFLTEFEGRLRGGIHICGECAERFAKQMDATLNPKAKA